MQNNPFGHLLPQQPAQQRPQPTFNADPIVAPAPPSERRAERDQQLQEVTTAQQLRIDAERLRLAQQGEQRQQTQADRDADIRAKGFDATEGERKSAAFLLRALGANSAFEKAGVGPRSMIGQAARDTFPNATNYFTSAERQVAESAQDEFIAASLRQDSGAAIPEEELERQRRIYFPMPGDGPEVLEQKRQARLRAIAGLEQSAGRLLPQTQEEWARMSQQGQQGQQGGATENGYSAVSEQESIDAWGEVYRDAQGNPVGNGFYGEAFREDGSSVFVGRVTDESPMQRGYGSAPRGGFLVLEDGSVLTGYDDNGNPIYQPYQEGMQADPAALQMRRQMGFDRPVDAVQTIMSDAGTLGFGDEISGVGGAIGAALRGEDVGVGYEAGRARAQRESQLAREQLGEGGSLALELLTGGAGGRAVGGVRAGLGVARQIATRGAPVTRQAIQRGLTVRAGGAGAAIGATAGAGSGETLQQRGTNALAGGTFGGVLGAGGQAIGNRLANRAAPAAGQPAQVQQAADALGIEPIPAMTGGTATRRLTAGARQGFISDQPIAGAVNRMEARAGEVRSQASQAAGRAVDDEQAGEIVRQGAQVYARRTSEIGGKLYDRADRMSAGVQFPLNKARAVARQELDELAKSPGGADSTMGRELADLLSQMGGRRFDAQGVRAFRTRLRNEIVQRGLRGSPQDRIYQRVLDAAERDLETGLRNAGKEGAVRALKTASAFWRNRVETIDQVLDPLIGKNAPRSGEQILASLERMARPDSGSASNLRRLMQAMPKDEAAAVRATVINRLGRPTAGASEVDREGFSFATFLTNWNNMTPRARATMFPPESREALEQLATVAGGVKRAGSAMNTSNTAGAIISQGAITGGLAWAVDPFTAGGAALSQYAAGRLLASPRFARLLARAPRQDTPQARQALDRQLGNLARAEPAIANEIGLYQRALAANDNNAVRSVAAEDENQQPR